MKISSVISLGFCFSILQGCATLNESECVTADWRDIGFKDGLIGERSNQLSRHQKACGKHGISVDVDSYSRGRNEGLKTFCTAKIGYGKGIDGVEYFDVCPESLAADFKSSYVKGLKLKLEQLSIEQDQVESELTTSRLERAALASRGPNKKINDHIDYLQTRQQTLLNNRLEIQRWIAKWSSP